MIGWLRRMIRREIDNFSAKAVPTPVSHSLPLTTVYKISNGYLVHQAKNGSPYRDTEDVSVVFCATPMEVARQFIGDEALKKMGLQRGSSHDPEQTVPMHTRGSASAKFGA